MLTAATLYVSIGIVIGTICWISDAYKIKGWGNAAGHEAFWKWLFLCIVGQCIPLIAVFTIISATLSGIGLGMLWLVRRYK